MASTYEGGPDADLILPDLKAGLDRYAEHHIPTGSFLRAVLENNLTDAISRADLASLDNLKHIVSYCYNRIPLECWGSKERVQEWLDKRVVK